VGGTCTIGVALRPTSTGAKFASLLATAPSGSQAAAKTMTGTGSPADASIATPPDGAVIDASTH
jgi:hypothetical protein